MRERHAERERNDGWRNGAESEPDERRRAVGRKERKVRKERKGR